MLINITNYTFNPTNKSITFNDFENIEIERIISIINLTTGDNVYNLKTEDERVGGNVLIVPYLNVTRMSSDDKLQIIYDLDVDFVKILENTAAVVAVDDTSTAGVTYLQYSDGAIRKWVDNVRYVALKGTLWVNRIDASYNAETV